MRRCHEEIDTFREFGFSFQYTIPRFVQLQRIVGIKFVGKMMPKNDLFIG